MNRAIRRQTGKWRSGLREMTGDRACGMQLMGNMKTCKKTGLTCWINDLPLRCCSCAPRYVLYAVCDGRARGCTNGAADFREDVGRRNLSWG